MWERESSMCLCMRTCLALYTLAVEENTTEFLKKHVNAFIFYETEAF